MDLQAKHNKTIPLPATAQFALTELNASSRGSSNPERLDGLPGGTKY